MKKLHDCTLEDFRAMETFGYDNPELTFNGFVIVPMPELHDCGFPFIKVIAADNDEIVGVFSGCADIIAFFQVCDYISYGPLVDILPESGCVHVFAHEVLFQLREPSSNYKSMLTIKIVER